MSAERVNKTYTPQQLRDAIALLQDNPLHNFSEGDAAALVKAFYLAGWRLVKVS